MSDTSSMTPILGILALVGLCVFGVALWRLRYRGAEAEEQAQRQAIIEQGVATGELTSDGHRTCVICGERATEYFPASIASWMDQIPLLNRLFSLPPRYVIADDVPRDLCLCRSHKAVAVKKLEEFHAILRAERARFNSAQQDKVSQMDTGGLEQCVLEQHQQTQRALSALTRTPAPQLKQWAESHHEEPAVTIVMSPSSEEE